MILSLVFAFACIAISCKTVAEPTTNTTATTERDVASPTDRAARQADVNAQNNRNVRESEDLLRSETERSTGKEMKNPAETNSTTVKPPVLSDPATAPLRSGTP